MKIPKIKQYLSEEEIWEKAGKPYRSFEKIDELYNICSSCEHFHALSARAGQCQVCTCFIRKGKKSFNKLAWATTKCPLENPKWDADVKLEDDNVEIVEAVDTVNKTENTNDKIEFMEIEEPTHYTPSSPPNPGCGSCP